MTILADLEQFLLSAVDAALPNDVTTFVGPWDSAPGVYIHARKLVLEPLGEDPPQGATAHLVTIHGWPTDGSIVDFELPPELGQELLDVEAPPGFLATRGDHYFVDGRTLRFYRPPVAGNPGVRARVQGDPARGYRRRRRCTISLELCAIGAELVDVDAGLEVGLQASLIQLLDLPLLASGLHPNVHIRIQVSLSALQSIERERMPSQDQFRATAALELRGEIELIVASGTPEPVGIIESIEFATAVHGPTNPAAPAQPEPPEPRPLVAQPVTVVMDPADATELANLDPAISTLAELAALDVDAFANQLNNPTTTRTHVQRAKLVLAAFTAGIPQLPPAVDAKTIDELLAMNSSQLGALTGLGTAYAERLQGELLTLAILLTSAASAALTLADFR